MMALAKLEAPSGVAPLLKLLRDPNANTRRTALQALGEMRRVPEAKRVVTDVLPLLDDPKPEVRMTACATVACLADPGDAAAIRALSPLLDADREIQWNAAMTLARLGNRKGRLVLMNASKGPIRRVSTLIIGENGAASAAISGGVSRNLVAAIDAAGVRTMLKSPG
jgi:HEAT repeat protein